jgi:hypothetical protein
MSETVLLAITALALAASGVMAIVTWRVIRREHLRGEARVAALADEIDLDADRPDGPRAVAGHRPAIGLRAEPARIPRSSAAVAPALVDDVQPRAVQPAPANLFAAPAEPARPRIAAVVAIGVLVVGTAAALAVILSAGSRATVGGDRRPAAAATHPQPAALPLELLALRHERDGKRLTVRGVVRNPDGAAPQQELAASVVVFGPDGRTVATGRARVSGSALAPGASAPFVVEVADAGDVARYRVSFRNDRGIVEHVDKRIKN